MLFSIIIINYKQKKFTENCVQSVKTFLPGSSYEIILVNNSRDDKVNMDGVRIIENANKGFAQANNLAAKSASGKYLLFLNADTILEKDFSKIFLDNFSNKDFGAVGIGLKNPDNTFQLSFWRENTFMNEIQNKKMEIGFKTGNERTINEFSSIKDPIQVDWVSGAAMIIPRDVFVELNGFNEEFYLFYEDADICKRIYDIEKTVYYMPFDGLVHFKGENVNPDFKTDTYYYSKKSQIFYYKKHNSFSQRIILRVYLFARFVTLSFKGKLYRRILKLVMGMDK
ncbi:MAG: glycosyltransferase [Ignavibacteria bacterium]|nr:glycosyltransferase [Ignavibacteria bacterium]